ncbi:DUF3892 domain-containing protein [Mucilaginibacter sp. 21P]|uniref:DUF3892 domain-containing protein n=1 Tax=Mucilaginibacter sp. 21P TaxID=2778902 RepID=UPI001C58BC66|nr:DUF3892 domain-containing protein [Mucilaginibacter sp. 21P]QXV63618.1 DUF3892 domain-containing protein [Mucilaginibacter sp. 21P]
MAYKVTHIRLSSGGTTTEHITNVKSTSDGGSTYEETVAEVIKYLKNGSSYYVSVSGSRAEVTYVKKLNGTEYIKTKPDNTEKDNLLSLPRF